MTKDAICDAIARYGTIQLCAAMFDMDGVLFDSMKNHAYSWHKTMLHFGFRNFPVEEAYMHEGRTGAGTINIVSQRERGHDATPEEVEQIYRYKAELFNRCPVAEPMPGAYDLLLKVKASGVTPMVVTGSGQKTLLGRLNTHFPGVFRPELMVTAFDVKKGKPNPEPYLMGMQKFAAFQAQNAAAPSVEPLTPNHFIVIENAPLGVQAAVAAGVFTIAVNTGPLPDEALLSQGANLLFPSMQSLCDHWELLLSCLS
jgi:beta-phosphoglucomutase-like phosphatase (HAD superfamily)